MISLIYLSGGSILEDTFNRHLRRVNADKNTPIETTEKLLQRMIADGYLSRSKDNSSGEEVVEYRVGPRGKVEVGEDGVAGLVKKVYGDAADEDLLQRLNRTLKLSRPIEHPPAGAGPAHPRKRKRQTRQQESEINEEDEEEEADETEESEDE
jgi:hypothetical protein